MSKEELKNLKKKMEFWFWFAFVNFSVMSLCFYDQFMEISNSTFIQFKNGENDAVAEVYFALKNLPAFL